MKRIKKILLEDGTELDATALAYITLTEEVDGKGGNVEISSPEGKKINIEAGDNVSMKPVGTLQLDTAHYPLEKDRNKFVVKVVNDDGDIIEGVELCAAGIDIKNNKADANNWDVDKLRIRIMKKKDVYTRLVLNAASIDMRCRTTGKGTGGGIAQQISSCDSGYKENKFKIETDRKKDVSEGLAHDAASYAAMYDGEGGNGIEILTINSQFLSAFNASYRFRANSPVYAVTRGQLVETDGKVDYPTQEDDSKDIINDSNPVTWKDIIDVVKFVKGTTEFKQYLSTINGEQLAPGLGESGELDEPIGPIQ